MKVSKAEFLGIDMMDEDELRDTVLDLLADNAKLRELLALATDMARGYDGDRRALRRLVRDMFGQLLNAYDWKELDDFADRMRELGVGGVE